MGHKYTFFLSSKMCCVCGGCILANLSNYSTLNSTLLSNYSTSTTKSTLSSMNIQELNNTPSLNLPERETNTTDNNCECNYVDEIIKNLGLIIVAVILFLLLVSILVIIRIKYKMRRVNNSTRDINHKNLFTKDDIKHTVLKGRRHTIIQVI